MSEIQEKDKVTLVQWIDTYIEKSAIENQPDISNYVGKLRQQNPNISDIDLAKKIVHRKSFKNGLLGATTGVGGLITLPVTVPANLIITWKMQIYLALTIAYIFGHTGATTDLKTDVYLILAGDSSKEALKRFGIEVGKAVTKKAIEKNISRAIVKKIGNYFPQKIITKAGQKSMTSFVKMVPLIGAPIGYGFNYYGTKTLGEMAIKYYSGK
jgi:hypothetical protein